MKQAILCCVILCSGCTTLEPVGRLDEWPGDGEIRIEFRDGRHLDVAPFHHVRVEEPSDFIYGVGTEMLTRTEFRGRLPQSEIDSIVASRSFIACWTKTGGKVVFREGEYVNVESSLGTGIWCAGEFEDGTLFSGKVDPEEISLVRPSPLIPIYAGVAAGGLVGVIAMPVAPIRGVLGGKGNEGKEDHILMNLGAGMLVGGAIGGIVVLVSE